jgi:hypothetical protein
MSITLSFLLWAICAQLAIRKPDRLNEVLDGAKQIPFSRFFHDNVGHRSAR